MFLSDADQLREARAFSAELESNVRRLARERDEARAEVAHLRRDQDMERMRSERAELQRRASHIPGLTADLDEARADLDKLRALAEAVVLGPDLSQCDYNDERSRLRLWWIDSMRRKARAALETVRQAGGVVTRSKVEVRERREVERLQGVVETLEADFARRQAAHRCATWDDGQGKCECNNLLRTVAERQREACAAAVEAIQLPRRSWEDGEQSIGRHDGIEDAAEKVRATPLVTEGEL